MDINFEQRFRKMYNSCRGFGYTVALNCEKRSHANPVILYATRKCRNFVTTLRSTIRHLTQRYDKVRNETIRYDTVRYERYGMMTVDDDLREKDKSAIPGIS